MSNDPLFARNGSSISNTIRVSITGSRDFPTLPPIADDEDLRAAAQCNL
jgi:hypothetical protein